MRTMPQPLRREALAPLLPAPLDDRPARARAHALAETVRLGAFARVRLVGPFHSVLFACW